MPDRDALEKQLVARALAGRARDQPRVHAVDRDELRQQRDGDGAGIGHAGSLERSGRRSSGTGAILRA